MHFVLQTPSLEHVAGVKIVSHLWNQRDNFSRIRRTCYLQKEPTKQWKEVVEEKMKRKVLALSLPVTCKKELLNYVTPIGMEIIAWCRYHNLGIRSSNFLGTFLPQQFCWTMHGTIDYAKTAELMVKVKEEDVVRRYEIACVNCLADEAAELFESMGEERRQECVNRVSIVSRREHQYLYITYFTCTLTANAFCIKIYLEARDSRSISVNRVLFESALLNGGTMCEYWFNRLSQQEKEVVLEDGEIMYVCSRSRTAKCLVYYLPFVKEEQRRRLFRECTRQVLEGLLGWPMKSLFMEAVKCGWSYMDKKDCYKVLRCIVNKICKEFGDYDYAQLFWVCWRLTSAECKQYYLNDVLALIFLLQTKDEKFIKLVLNEAPWNQLKELQKISFLSFYDYEIKSEVLMDERVISDAALRECKQTALLSSSNAPEDAEKRLRSEHLTNLVDLVMKWRLKRRSNAL